MDNEQSTVIIINTAVENKLPFPWKGTALAIVGQDFVFKTADGHIYKLPFSAQFAALNGVNFSLLFSDEKRLTSKELINQSVDGFKNIDGHLTNQIDVKSNENTHEKIVVKTVVKTVVEKIAIPADSPQQQSHDDVRDDNTDFINDDHDLEPVSIIQPIQPIIFSSSTSGIKAPLTDSGPALPNPNAVDYVTDLSQLQLATQIDTTNHTVMVGGGSRTDGGYQAQYGVQVVDITGYDGDYTIDARLRGSADGGTTLTRIIRLDDATTITGVTALNSNDYQVISCNSEQGKAMGLEPNEFAIVYNTQTDEKFNVNVSFSPPDSQGNSYYNLGFHITSDPTSVMDDDGYTLLGMSPTPLIIKGGSGNDHIIAGGGQDIYDGGGGHNSIDYSNENHSITVDFQADNKSALSAAGLTDTDSATVTNGNVTQVINNVQEIYGTNYGDTFITGAGEHIFHGGNGNDTFISEGGSNTFDGGGGINTVDYRNVGGIEFGHIDYNAPSNGADLIKIDLNGVDIDLSNNITSVNGWQDQNGNFGTDKISNIQMIYGSEYNDLIVCGDGDYTIFGVAGDNVIIVGRGNDIIDGGTGNSVIDYSTLNEEVDVNLNSGVATKSNGNSDKITNISEVIGSTGGGILTGKNGSDNILIGTAGDTTFIINGGSSTLEGGRDSNHFSVSNSISVIYADGFSNTVLADSDLLTFYGSANGVDDIIINGGNNTLYLGKGDTTVSFGYGAYSKLYTDNGGSLTYYGGNTYSILYLDDETNVTLDYHAVTTIGFEADLVHGVISISDGTSQDAIKSGTVNTLIGSVAGSGIYDAHTYVTNIEFVGYGSNNKFLTGTGSENEVIVKEDGVSTSSGNYITLYGGTHNHIEIEDAGSNNTVDYSHAPGVLNIDLNDQVASKNGFGGTDDLIGVDTITANRVAGATFTAADGVDCTFNATYVKNAIIYSAENGNDTYNIYNIGQGYASDSVSKSYYNSFSAGINVTFSTGSTTVTKAGGVDKYNGFVNTIYGTNYGDTVYVNNPISSEGLIYYGGTGNDDITLKINNGNNSNKLLNMNESGGYNTFTIADNRSNSNTITITSSDQNGEFSIQSGSTYTVNGISKLIINSSSTHSTSINWGNNNHIDVKVDNAGAGVTFNVNGGGNKIDGGSVINYTYTSSGITADLDTGVITFADGRDSDSVNNIYGIYGSNSDDIITGHSDHQDDFYATKGNDIINGNSTSGNDYHYSLGYADIDLQSGIVQKYDNNNTNIGKDQLSDIQKYSFTGGGLGETTTIHESNSGDYVVNIDANTAFKIFGLDGSNVIYNGTATSGTSTFDYTLINDSMSMHISGSKIQVDKGDGTDTLNIAGKEQIDLGNGDDTIFWSHWGDVVDSNLTIVGGSGNDVLKENAGGDSAVDIGSLSNITNVEEIDLTAVAHTSITFDVNAFFNAHSTQSDLTIDVSSNDYSHLVVTDYSGWTANKTDPNKDVYTYTNNISHIDQTLTINHAA